MWMQGETPVGGVMELPAEAVAEGASPHWLAYIGTPDVEAALTRAGELGARVIVPAMDLPDVGRMAILADPQGIVFAIYTPSADVGEESAPEAGNFSWHELATSDWEAAWAFYSELFGWEKTDAMDMGEGNMYQMFSRPGGDTLGGMFNRPPEMPISGWLLYTRVPSSADAAEAVTVAGGQVLNGPMEVPGGDEIAQCMDPQGATFAVHSIGTTGQG